jgi:hypothetical protein
MHTVIFYNNNFKIYAIANFDISFQLSGFIKPETFIHALELDPYIFDNPSMDMRIVFEVIFVGLTFFSLVADLKAFRDCDWNLDDYAENFGDLPGILI